MLELHWTTLEPASAEYSCFLRGASWAGSAVLENVRLKKLARRNLLTAAGNKTLPSDYQISELIRIIACGCLIHHALQSSQGSTAQLNPYASHMPPCRVTLRTPLTGATPGTGTCVDAVDHADPAKRGQQYVATAFEHGWKGDVRCPSLLRLVLCFASLLNSFRAVERCQELNSEGVLARFVRPMLSRRRNAA